MTRDPLVLLDDILASVRAIRKYVAGHTYESFLADEMIQDAVIRRFEVMGEAARRLPDAFQEAYPAIPWRKIVGMRNVLAHEYDDIALEILWDTIENQLDALEDSIRALLGSHG